MKKCKALVMILMMLMLVSSIAAPAFAAEMKGEEINLDKKGSYKLIVPNVIEHKIIKKSFAGKEYPLDIIVVEMPQKNADGAYPIYEIVTTDKKAHNAVSFPRIFGEDFIGVYQEKFANGSLVYAPKFTLGDKDLKDVIEGNIFTLSFTVYDDEYRSNDLFESPTLYFMFENKGVPNAAAQETPKSEAATPAKRAASKVMVNGKEIAFEAYEIAGSNYFKLRDLAQVMNGTNKQFKVDWDGAKNDISLTAGEAYTPDGKEFTVSANSSAMMAKATSAKVYVNGQEVQLVAYEINNNNYFKLRDIAQATDFAVTWDAKANTVGIDSSAGYTE
ncbi:stalk domain-containing protein [Paenibacillus sp. KN14-4R]|uniref:stalk domain-containing protein n=1 Tax=Paenibacillus sp. KN14-4R TaxID=3445773 RepID=UPI003FA0DACD